MKMMRNNWTKLTLMLAAVLLIAAGCGKTEYKPRAVNEETDKCVICNMSIKDVPSTTQLITTDGQSLMFDDIGCMNEWKVQNGTDTVGAEFVRDHHSGDWIKYEKAFYAYDANYKTPMAYGIIAFEDEASAKDYITEQGSGTLMNAEQLAGHSWEVNRDMMDMHGEHGHGEASHSHVDDMHEDDEEAVQEGNHS